MAEPDPASRCMCCGGSFAGRGPTAITLQVCQACLDGQVHVVTAKTCGLIGSAKATRTEARAVAEAIKHIIARRRPLTCDAQDWADRLLCIAAEGP